VLQFLINLIIMASIAAIVASSLNLLIGYTGVFSIAHAIFYGVGGYAGALVSLHLGTSLLVALLIAMVSSAVISVLLALPAARVTGEYFVVVSLAFALVVFTVFSQWTPVTGGAAGLVGISRATIFGIPLNTNEAYLGLSLVLLLLVTVVMYVIVRRTPLGRSLQALRDDPLAAQALGKNPFRLRLIAVLISSALASTAGVIYAGYVAFVNADTFSVNAGVLFMAMVILGGAGTLSGPVIGAFFITLFPEALEFADLPSELKGPLEQIIYGAALVLLMLVRPSGIAGMFSGLLPKNRRGAGLPAAAAEGQPVAGGPAADEYTPTGGAA
jgi:branched-chain amino acid transport system permease protein